MDDLPDSTSAADRHVGRATTVLAVVAACLLTIGATTALRRTGQTMRPSNITALGPTTTTQSVVPFPSTTVNRAPADRLVARIVSAATGIDRSKAQIALSSSQLVGALSQWDTSAAEFDSVARELRTGTVTAVPASVALTAADKLERAAASWRTSSQCFRTIIAAGPYARQDPSACNGRGEDPMVLVVGAAFDLSDYTSAGLAGLTQLIAQG